MRIYDTYLTGVLAGHGPRMPWGFSSSMSRVEAVLTSDWAVATDICTATANKQRLPGTQGVPL